MALQIYTAQYNYKGANRLDIIIQSGNRCFAPTWKIVKDYKNGIITAEEYTKIYYDLMDKSYRNNRSEWNKLLARDKVVLCCFCKSGVFCLSRILVEKRAKYLGEITNKGVFNIFKKM